MATDFTKFPYTSEKPRLEDYDYFKQLFKGQHFAAFNIRIHSEQYTRDYSKMRYVCANFPGLISKVIADMLFIEPPKIEVNDGDQKWINALLSENKMRMQLYESSLMNSYFGDALFKLRIGKRNPKAAESTVIIDQVTPRIYFPRYDGSNVTGEPTEQELAWIVEIADNKYLRKEIHTPGLIRNELWLLEGNDINGYEIKAQADLSLLTPDEENIIPQEQETGIDRSLLIHIPNWRAGESWNGVSDYYDLDSLFYAINNRFTKIDNILDLHGDPIFTVPPGVIGEDGKVKKKALGVIEIAEGETGKPEYIVWDAKLESAFSELEDLIENVFMISETAPAILGMDKNGQAESGRALKFKLLRTIAKAQRKQIYYREGIIESVYVAQLLAKEWKVKVDGLVLSANPVKPEIMWSDGLPADMTEMIENETKAIDAGITSKKDAIIRVYDVDEDTAEEMVKEIDEESPLAEIPGMTNGKDTGKFGNGGSNNPKATPPAVN